MYLEKKGDQGPLCSQQLPLKPDASKYLGLPWWRRRENDVTQKVKKWFPKQPKTDLLNNPLMSFKIKCSAELETLVD